MRACWSAWSFFKTGCNISSLIKEQRAAEKSLFQLISAGYGLKLHRIPTCSGHCVISSYFQERLKDCCVWFFCGNQQRNLLGCLKCILDSSNFANILKNNTLLTWINSDLNTHIFFFIVLLMCKLHQFNFWFFFFQHNLLIFLPLAFLQWITMKMSTSSTGGSSTLTWLASQRGSSLQPLSSGSTRTLSRSALRTKPSDLASTS